MTLATLVSRVFDPILVSLAVLIIAFAKSGLPQARMLQLFLVVTVIAIVIPGVLFFQAIRHKKLDGWDLQNRAARITPFFVELLFLLAAYALIVFYGNAFLQSVWLLFLVIWAGFLVITLFWKISGHTTTTTLAALLFVRWFGLSWWPLFLAIPLVGWSRVARKNHTAAQVVGGALYSMILVLLMGMI